MYRMLEHPEIAHIQRTGYPSWIDDRDEDDYYDEDLEEDCYDEDALYEERMVADYGRY